MWVLAAFGRVPLVATSADASVVGLRMLPAGSLPVVVGNLAGILVVGTVGACMVGSLGSHVVALVAHHHVAPLVGLQDLVAPVLLAVLFRLLLPLLPLLARTGRRYLPVHVPDPCSEGY